AEALQSLVEEELAADGLLHPRVVAIAGAMGLVLGEASASERHEFAKRVMRPAMVDPALTSEDLAYAMLVAWMEQ
ncbi:MAG TPA: hypothetical protein VM869_16290, partial [Enhygromyxa sp.]|nr:hypothetical protein [Enhygromyxa sp.]